MMSLFFNIGIKKSIGIVLDRVVKNLSEMYVDNF